MGKKLIDAYTISHFIGGIIFERMQLSFITANGLHLFFEIFENLFWVPYHGGRCVKLPFLKYEDCKNQSDSFQNSVTDQMAFALGFIFSKKYLADKYYMPKWSLIFGPLVPLVLSTIFTNIIKKNPQDEYDETKEPSLKLFHNL